MFSLIYISSLSSTFSLLLFHFERFAPQTSCFLSLIVFLSIPATLVIGSKPFYQHHASCYQFKETWLESSGHPYDTDDEDFITGSGSGMPAEEMHDDATVYTIAPGKCQDIGTSISLPHLRETITISQGVCL